MTGVQNRLRDDKQGRKNITGTRLTTSFEPTGKGSTRRCFSSCGMISTVMLQWGQLKNLTLSMISCPSQEIMTENVNMSNREIERHLSLSGKRTFIESILLSLSSVFPLLRMTGVYKGTYVNEFIPQFSNRDTYNERRTDRPTLLPQPMHQFE